MITDDIELEARGISTFHQLFEIAFTKKLEEPDFS
jgi:hypothetical protein